MSRSGRHLKDDELLDELSGRGRDAAPYDHLAECVDCRTRRQELRQMIALLDALPVPSRDDGYGRQIWARVQQRARKPEKRFSLIDWTAWQLRVSAGLALLLVISSAFLIGRYTARTQPNILPKQVRREAPANEPVRERLLLVAVGDHLERSQTVLLELEHAATPNERGAVDISAERRRAESLLEANRLYRDTALRVGDPGVATVLDELERLLLEVAHSPDRVSARDVEALQKRMQSQGILFKVRVLNTRIRGTESRPPSSDFE